MTQEDKELLLKDLCARLHYKMICSIYRVDDEGVGWRDAICKGYYFSDYDYEFYFEDVVAVDDIQHIKPYLRPISSMTKEEVKELENYIAAETISSQKGLFAVLKAQRHTTNFLYSRHLDVLGLIEKRLALPAPEGMYNIK